MPFKTSVYQVLLTDRGFNLADVVRRFVPGRETQCGIVQDFDIKCHLHIIGTDQYIYNVDSRELSPCMQMEVYFDFEVIQTDTFKIEY